MSDLTYPDAIALAAFFLALGFWSGCSAIANSITSFGDDIRSGMGNLGLDVSLTIHGDDDCDDVDEEEGVERDQKK